MKVVPDKRQEENVCNPPESLQEGLLGKLLNCAEGNVMEIIPKAGIGVFGVNSIV